MSIPYVESDSHDYESSVLYLDMADQRPMRAFGIFEPNVLKSNSNLAESYLSKFRLMQIDPKNRPLLGGPNKAHFDSVSLSSRLIETQATLVRRFDYVCQVDEVRRNQL